MPNEPVEDKDPGVLQRIFTAGPQGVMQFGAILFTIAAVVAFTYGIFSLITLDVKDVAKSDGKQAFDVWKDIVAPNFSTFALIFVGIVSALLGSRLFSKAGALTNRVVREEEREYLWPLITNANKDAIAEYIRLASLTGFSGSFTKLGFTGLPLVTVALTLILLALTLATPEKLQSAMFDLAKLTLGAFLGSFVQRNIEQEKLAGRTPAAPESTNESTNKTPAERAAAEAAAAQKAAAEKAAVEQAAAQKAAAEKAAAEQAAAENAAAEQVAAQKAAAEKAAAEKAAAEKAAADLAAQQAAAEQDQKQPKVE
jgi:hypothetical protein